jgi:hypothetical protein
MMKKMLNQHSRRRCSPQNIFLILAAVSFFTFTVNAGCPFGYDLMDDSAASHAAKHGDSGTRSLFEPAKPTSRNLKHAKKPKPSKNTCLSAEGLASQVAQVRKTFAPNLTADGYPAANAYSICSMRAGLSYVESQQSPLGPYETYREGYIFADLPVAKPGMIGDVDVYWVDNSSPFLAQFEFVFDETDLALGPDSFQGLYDFNQNEFDLVESLKEEGGGIEFNADYDNTMHCTPISKEGLNGYSFGDMFCEGTSTLRPGGTATLNARGDKAFSDSYNFYLVQGNGCPCDNSEEGVRSDIVYTILLQ